MTERIAPAAKLVRRVAATALTAAPLVWGGAVFSSDLHRRPPGRRAAEIAPAVLAAPLQPDVPMRIPLAPDSIPYRSVALRLEAAAPAQLELQICGRVECDDRAVKLASAEVVTLPVPHDAAAGGAVFLSPTTLSGGPVSLRGDAATPAVEVIQGYSWRLPARRARRVFHAMAGVDGFDASLVACALALAVGFVVCLVLSLGKDVAP
jgi:hypothetical protein